MEFTNNFHVPLPLEETWKLMLDVPRILPCLPGASLKETLGENKYLGSVSVKLGPIKLSFDGQAELVRADDVNHIAWLRGSGLDPKGRGSAQSEFSFALQPTASSETEVTVTTQLQLSGAVAQYGRGSGMIAEVAGHILKQFEHNLAASLHEGPEEAHNAAHASADAPDMPPAPATSACTDTRLTASQTSAVETATLQLPQEAKVILLQAQAVLAQTQALLAASQQALHKAQRGANPKAAKPKELNMLAIGLKALWSQIKHGVGGIFRHR